MELHWLDLIWIAGDIFRLVFYVILVIGLIMLACEAIKVLKDDRHLNEEKRREIKRLKAINDHYEKYIDKGE